MQEPRPVVVVKLDRVFNAVADSTVGALAASGEAFVGLSLAPAHTTIEAEMPAPRQRSTL